MSTNPCKVILFLLTVSLQAQVNQQSDLFKEMQAQDSIFFERGFNQCDLPYLEQHISADLKFYHDQSGFQDKAAFFENTKKYICADSPKKPIRKIDKNSLEVFPLYKDGTLYGAIQKGIHHFYLRTNKEADLWTATAKFTHVWILENGLWKLSEVLSFDHNAPEAQESVSPIEGLLSAHHVPTLGLGIVENGRLSKIEVYGSLGPQIKAPYNTIFKVASLTKPIVALIALKLIDNNLLDLNEPLDKYWIDPDIKNDKWRGKLTPKIVLTHQTGFPNWRYLTPSKRLAFAFEPGTRYQYSGEGFEYLRKAIESKLGKSIEVLAKEFLFDPLGMTDTHFWWDQDMDESRYAQNYDAKGQQLPTKKYYEANAAANLLTTVEDYGKFLAYLTNGAGLSTHWFDELKKPQVTLKANDFFGLGWEILTGFPNGEYALLHTGKDPGVSTLAVWFPKSKNAYLIFLNGDDVDPVYEYLLKNSSYLGSELWDKR